MHAIAISALRTRITAVFPAQIRAAVAPLSDEQFWWRPNEESNSIGNLLLHLTGSLNLYLSRNIGGIDYERDRAAEFADRGSLSRTEVLSLFEEMVARAEKTFDGLTAARLEEPSPEPKMHSIILEDLLNVLAHLSTHTGQIVWIAKSFDGRALHEVWIKTHRDLGAWKRT